MLGRVFRLAGRIHGETAIFSQKGKGGGVRKEIGKIALDGQPWTLYKPGVVARTFAVGPQTGSRKAGAGSTGTTKGRTVRQGCPLGTAERVVFGRGSVKDPGEKAAMEREIVGNLSYQGEPRPSHVGRRGKSLHGECVVV